MANNWRDSNPWVNFLQSNPDPPYILDIDKEQLLQRTRNGIARSEEGRLFFEVPPSPFQGSLDTASVVLLAKNPSCDYEQEPNDWMSNTTYRQHTFDGMTFESNPPMW